MRHSNETLFAVMLVANLAWACGSDHMDDGDVSAFSDQIQTARSEVARHHHTALTAPTLSELMAEVDHHDARMSSIMDGMNAMMGDMSSHCSGSMTGMHETMSAMGSEMMSHHEDVGDAITLDEARTQCTAHTEAMNGMLDNMHAGLRTMGCMGNR